MGDEWGVPDAQFPPGRSGEPWGRWDAIDPFDELPALHEQHMDEKGCDEQWITVQEFRDRYDLTGENGHVIAAFLHRLMYHPVFGLPFVVRRIERNKPQNHSQIVRNRYLVTRR